MRSETIIADTPGLTYRRLDYWCRAGYLGQGHARPVGSGYQRNFSAEEVARLRHMAFFVTKGFEVKAAAEIAEEAVFYADDGGKWSFMSDDGLMEIIWVLPKNSEKTSSKIVRSANAGGMMDS